MAGTTRSRIALHAVTPHQGSTALSKLSLRVIDQYLSKYALLPGGCPELTDRWQHVLVIPCFDEPADFLANLEVVHGETSLLVVLVMNRPALSKSDINRPLKDYLARWATQSLQLGYQLHTSPRSLTVLSIDLERLEGATPIKEGVGRGRRVGCDVALALIARGTIASQWIYSGDADASWPSDFFRQCWPETASAISLPFTHHLLKNDPTSAATLLYELKLHHYVLHLAALGSPYAFHALGSSFATSAVGYAAVRGVPLRSAGEDFYLLNKLAKVGVIHRATGPGVSITSRRSTRVPFGTGPAVATLLESADISRAPLFYDARCFNMLGIVLELFGRWINYPNTDTEADLRREIGPTVASGVLNLLKQWHYKKAITHIHNAAQSAALRNHHTHIWLDGFKLLKLIHVIRDGHYPNITFFDSVNRPGQWPIELHTREPEQMRQAIYQHLGWQP
jgi:hypothetical protein